MFFHEALVRSDSTPVFGRHIPLPAVDRTVSVHRTQAAFRAALAATDSRPSYRTRDYRDLLLDSRGVSLAGIRLSTLAILDLIGILAPAAVAFFHNFLGGDRDEASADGELLLASFVDIFNRILDLRKVQARNIHITMEPETGVAERCMMCHGNSASWLIDTVCRGLSGSGARFSQGATSGCSYSAVFSWPTSIPVSDGLSATPTVVVGDVMRWLPSFEIRPAVRFDQDGSLAIMPSAVCRTVSTELEARRRETVLSGVRATVDELADSSKSFVRTLMGCERPVIRPGVAVTPQVVYLVSSKMRRITWLPSRLVRRILLASLSGGPMLSAEHTIAEHTEELRKVRAAPKPITWLDLTRATAATAVLPEFALSGRLPISIAASVMPRAVNRTQG